MHLPNTIEQVSLLCILHREGNKVNNVSNLRGIFFIRPHDQGYVSMRRTKTEGEDPLGDLKGKLEVERD